MIEYSRTAVVAHISQSTKGQQEGWGRPGTFTLPPVKVPAFQKYVAKIDADGVGTKWENQHLRSYITSTIPKLRQSLHLSSLAFVNILHQ